MDLPEDLGDGLVLRPATPADTEALVTFNAGIHREPGDDGPSPFVADRVRALLAGGHPMISARDFMVVEETGGGEIVSSLALLPDTWSYGGVPFGIGRIEFVGTRPDHRRRGLVRLQMGVAHRWCTERGLPVQAIAGIPNYYRRFGYEMALDLWGGRGGYLQHVPELPEGAMEPFRVRPAVVADVPFLASLDGPARDRWVVTAVRDEAFWRWLFAGGREERFRPALRVIERPSGEPVGYFAHAGQLLGDTVFVESYELAPGVSWLAVAPTVLRHLRAAGEALREPDAPGAFPGVAFGLGADHPIYRAIPDRLPYVRAPYAWYLRVPDLPGFLRRIAAALEARLAASVAPGHTGELRLSFYGDGLRLAFEEGRLAAAEAWEPGGPEDGDAQFPGLSFLQLLFGRRSLAELEHAAADCRATAGEARVLLDALFPARPSLIWPVA